jgi:hypothetical protein
MKLKCRLGFAALLTMCVFPSLSDVASAELPDSRRYEMISPVSKNGVSPYAAVPSLNGVAVNFQARGAITEATSGSLNLYQATRTSDHWQTTPLTPTPTSPLGALEEQAPVWFSADLSQTIFTTPQSYTSGDEDNGSLSLYKRDGGGLTWLSYGTQGANEPRNATFDGATGDGNHVVFSSAASLLPGATGLSKNVFPEAEYLYERDVSTSQTRLLSVDNVGQLADYAATTLAVENTVGLGYIVVARTEGLLPGQTITVGSGPSAETTQILRVRVSEGGTEQIVVNNGIGLATAHPAGTLVKHVAEGAVLGNGAHLTSGGPPASEYLAANAESGSTTNAISSDGSKVFFEAASPAGAEPFGLYMRKDGSTTVKIAGAAFDGSEPSGFGEETDTFGFARFEGAATDGSLMFFTSDEGLAGATKGVELYEYNTTERQIGGDPPMTVRPLSTGLQGDKTPTTTLTVASHFPEETITVASTAGFTAGEALGFGKFSINSGESQNSDLTSTIASVKSATELVLTGAIFGGGFTGVPAETEVHGVHPASLTAVSNDGSHVYFISDGVLALNADSHGATATPVKPNLYVFDTTTGATTFIATVASSDVSKEGHPAGLATEPDISRPAIPTPNGDVLVFASAGNLSGQNPWQKYTEIYRYVVTGNTLECLSCTAPGVKPTGNANFGETAGGTYDPPGLTSPISEDGSRVFFDTPDSLVPEDTNGSAPQSAKFGTPTSTDVYEAEGGKVFLLSSGKATTPTVLQGTTPSGDDVLFTTTAKLAPQDTDGGYENVWDARVGGGFPAEAGVGTPSCVGANCRAAFGVAPVFSSPASTTPQSTGNPPATVVQSKPKPLICRKGLVKRRLRGKVICARKSSRSATRAGHGASRAVALHVHRHR